MDGFVVGEPVMTVFALLLRMPVGPYTFQSGAIGWGPSKRGG
jgi:hypothetical protein